MKIANPILSTLTVLLISACGGGSSGNPAQITNEIDSDTQQEQTESANLQTGRFVDSAVSGLQYETATQSGVTDADGSFSYQTGESITFSIGGISLPARVMNLARLLQTLDTDGDPINGITISDAANASAAGLNVDFSSNQFDSQVVNLVANSGSSTTALVNGIEALDHLQEPLFVEGIDERPPMPDELAQQNPLDTQDNTSTHPLVGSSAIFSDIAHDISGTLTVIDDRTLQVTNFNYDGGGVVVFFYTGIDGNFRDGRPIGPQLNGRRYTNETITLTLPDDLTLDDFDGLSVWCVPFSFSFGDAQL